MVKIRAFQALLYNRDLDSDIGSLVSPPYDVLSKKDCDNLILKNKHNSVQLCLKKENQTYADLRKKFSEWKEQAVFQKVPQNSFYLIEENFEWDGKPCRRLGFVGLLEVSPFEEKKVLPHEFTLAGPKQDRLELLKTLRAELSQIFLCYEDPKEVLEEITSKLQKSAPYFEGTDPQGIHRKLWIVSEKQDIERLEDLLSDKEVLIADGHHRYETAIEFSQMEKSPESKYVQAYFTNVASTGFQILPIHRITSLPERLSQDSFLSHLAQSFQIERLPMDIDPQAFLRSTEDHDSVQFCLYFHDTRSGFHLKKKKTSETDAEIFSLQNDILEPVFGWNTSEISKGQLQFEHTTQGFFEKLQATPQGVGFFLPPTELDLVMKVVKQGKRMPQKSTFFFPKIASGLVIYELGSYSD